MEFISSLKEHASSLMFLMGVVLFVYYLEYRWCKKRGEPGRFFLSMLNMTEQTSLVREIHQDDGDKMYARIAAFIVIWFAVLFVLF